MSEPTQEPSTQTVSVRHCFVLAVACFVGAGLILVVPTPLLELDHTLATMDRWMAILHVLGSKWFVAGVIALVGVVCIVHGLRQTMQRKSDDWPPND
jgi:hypothetical protein